MTREKAELWARACKLPLDKAFLAAFQAGYRAALQDAALMVVADYEVVFQGDRWDLQNMILDLGKKP